MQWASTYYAFFHFLLFSKATAAVYHAITFFNQCSPKCIKFILKLTIATNPHKKIAFEKICLKRKLLWLSKNEIEKEKLNPTLMNVDYTLALQRRAERKKNFPYK